MGLATASSKNSRKDSLLELQGFRVLPEQYLKISTAPTP